MTEPRESTIQRAIRLAVSSETDVLLFRNNVGVTQDTHIRYGLGVGSADLIGLVGGRFLAIEVKRPKTKPTGQQLAWLAAVNSYGGIAGVARSVEEAMCLVKKART